jgi:hypothetical protein
MESGHGRQYRQLAEIDAYRRKLSELCGMARQSKQKTPVQTLFDECQLVAIDAYRRKQSNPPTRAEAIRQLCALAIRGERPSFEGAAA